MLQLSPTLCVRVLAAVLLAGSSAFAADLCAKVMDYGRMPLPAASVNAANLRTGESYVAKSDKSGTACFLGLPEGLYSVEASLSGFLHVRYYPVRVVAMAKQRISFWLPLGEITEGGLGDESTLSGTLVQAGSPVEAAEICIAATARTPRKCTVTNDLGEYALQVPAGMYTVEVHTRDGKEHMSKVDVSAPGIYRNRLSVDGEKNEPHN